MENTAVTAEKHLRHLDVIAYSAGSLGCIVVAKFVWCWVGQSCWRSGRSSPPRIRPL